MAIFTRQSLVFTLFFGVITVIEKMKVSHLGVRELLRIKLILYNAVPLRKTGVISDYRAFLTNGSRFFAINRYPYTP